MGELHLEIVRSRLQEEYNVQFLTSAWQIEEVKLETMPY